MDGQPTKDFLAKLGYLRRYFTSTNQLYREQNDKNVEKLHFVNLIRLAFISMFLSTSTSKSTSGFLSMIKVN